MTRKSPYQPEFGEAHLETEAHRQHAARIGLDLTELYGDAVTPLVGYPEWLLRFGSVVLTITVAACGEDDALICFHFDAVHKPTLSKEVYRELLSGNNNIAFGGWGVDDEGTITFRYTMLASHTDTDLLRWAVDGFVQAVDELDDQLIAKWGGFTAEQALEQAASEAQSEEEGS